MVLHHSYSIANKLFLITDTYNLGQNRMEQLSPFTPPPPPPQCNDVGAKEQKRAILASLKWGEGCSRCSIYFVQDCRTLNTFLDSLDSKRRSDRVSVHARNKLILNFRELRAEMTVHKKYIQIIHYGVNVLSNQWLPRRKSDSYHSNIFFFSNGKN